MKLLREYIRKLLKEETESVVPKNQWEMLASGDPRREAVKNNADKKIPALRRY